MRSEEEILNKAREVFNKEKEKYINDRLYNKKSINCIHFDKLKVKNIGIVNYCKKKSLILNDSDNKLFVCDDNWSKRCEFYNCKYTKPSIEKEFLEIVSNPIVCSQKFPKLAVLLWIIGNKDSSDIKNEEITPKRPIKRSFFKSLINFISLPLQKNS